MNDDAKGIKSVSHKETMQNIDALTLPQIEINAGSTVARTKLLHNLLSELLEGNLNQAQLTKTQAEIEALLDAIRENVSPDNNQLVYDCSTALVCLLVKRGRSAEAMEILTETTPANLNDEGTMLSHKTKSLLEELALTKVETNISKT
jgi:hypothetical protein